MSDIGREEPMELDLKVRPRVFKSFAEYIDNRMEQFNYGQFQIITELWEEIQCLKQELADRNEVLFNE